ncbi:MULTISPECIES: type IV toxin-antitoxin system AbiEi family antitoxin [Acidiphilium]|jgi:predicted transcriptional regulator of viral defense system|uniref:type IV toxin-antitoxin system AbiEi family antitoxin domain-containing protein n=1 Tax=Acidiphilium TaxID=522 RepID=UPI0025853682|nr:MULTISPECIES: type IV toxin-antitoxin system AbiEi family antitoxin [Acidiphilium]HQT85100.1 type IV toxin-antitoxin system AbiEi family antitoxin [Acidiphilium rubrum]
MIRTERSALSSYASGLLAEGRGVFSADEAQKEIGISRGAFLDAAERLQRRGQLIRPRRGFYVVVPPQHSTAGAPPPEWYIDALMRHEKRPYYVGLLAAAAAHGASHQAVMEFQVVTDKLLPDIEAGRTRIVFSYRKDMVAVAAGIEDRKTQSGYMKLSSPELTALDLVRYPQSGAGLNNIATVLSELAERLQPEKLASLSGAFEKAIVQRLGHMLGRLGYPQIAEPMIVALSARGPLPWVELDPKQAGDPDLSPPPSERDDRWRVIVRRPPEIDE